MIECLMVNRVGHMILSSEGVTSPGFNNYNWQRTQFECLNGNNYNIVSFFVLGNCMRPIKSSHVVT